MAQELEATRGRPDQTSALASALPGRLRRLGRLARQKPLGTVSIVILLVIWLAAIAAPLVAPYYWHDTFYAPRLQGPSADFWLGTDDAGRDLFSRVIWAA